MRKKEKALLRHSFTELNDVPKIFKRNEAKQRNVSMLDM